MFIVYFVYCDTCLGPGPNRENHDSVELSSSALGCNITSFQMMAGPVDRSSERTSNDQLIEDSVNSKELNLFSKLADAIGDTLEAVCNMQERERSELITVLGLTGNDDNNVKILMLSGEDKSVATNITPNCSRQNSYTDSSDKQMNNNGSKELDNDLEMVAIRKRKRSTSSDTSRECKRVLSTSSSNGNTVNSLGKASSEFATQETGDKNETTETSGKCLLV